MIKVGVIGYGFSAKTFHLPMFEALDSFELCAISTSQSDAVKAKYPNVALFNCTEALINESGVDLVVITAPNVVHYELAMACLVNGIHVVLEKPMATTSIEAIALANYAKEKKLVLSVYHNRRWDGDFLTVKKLIETKSVGDVKLFESHFDRFRPNVRQRWREEAGEGTGIWFDLGSHLIDQAICLFGLPTSVTGRCLSLRENAQTTDYFHVQLHYPSVEVILHSSSFAAGPNQRFCIEGTKGSYVKYGLDPQEEQLKANLLPTESTYGVEQHEHYGTLYLEGSEREIKTETGCYQQFYIQLVQAISCHCDLPVDTQDAVNVIKIIELAELSSCENATLSFS